MTQRCLGSGSASDLELSCVNCGAMFWFTAGEKEYFQQNGLMPPKRCPSCRAARKNNQSVVTTPISRHPVAPPPPLAMRLAPPVPQLPQMNLPTGFDQNLFTADIEQLLYEANSPIVSRQRTFFEWLRGVDVEAEQLARKMAAAQTADELLQQRIALCNRFRELLEAATDTQLAVMNAKIRLLEAHLRQQNVEEEIAQHGALAGARLQTRLLQEQGVQRELQGTIHPPVDERQRVIDEHRRDRLARAHAGRTALADFLYEVRNICTSRVPNHQKALELREVMAAYEMAEDNLPSEARWILDTGERTRYGA